MSFAKLYGSDDDQVLVTLGTNDEGPEIRIRFVPKHEDLVGLVDTLESALTYEDSDSGSNAAEWAFNNTINEEFSREWAKTVEAQVLNMIDTPDDEVTE
jgi:hypothetical protein